MRILLADDEWEITRALKIMLERSQYTVDVAEDGAQALDYLENGSYDAVVLDVMMPQVDGLTVLRRMRAAGDHTPTLLLTAKADIDDRVAGLTTIFQNPFPLRNFWHRSGRCCGVGPPTSRSSCPLET